MARRKKRTSKAALDQSTIDDFWFLYDLGYLARARSGDTDVAVELAKLASDMIERGEPLPPVLRKHIVSALRAPSVDAALLLKRGRGQKRPQLQFEMDVAELVLRARRKFEIPLKSSASRDGAYAIAVECAKAHGLVHPSGTSLTDDMAEKYWKRHRRKFSLSIPLINWDEVLAQPFQSLSRGGRK